MIVVSAVRCRAASICLAAVATSAFGCGTDLSIGFGASAVRLQPEAATTLRVGDTATIELASDLAYRVGSAGNSLALVNQTHERGTTIYTYRAVEPGDQTFVATPRDPGPDGCISCVTVRYFVRVAQ